MSDRIVNIEERNGYRFIDFQSENMTKPLRMLETRCVDRCSKPHRVDEHHPHYASVVAGLERGDRSVVFCYHKPLKL